jgi:hypothetical protein
VEIAAEVKAEIAIDLGESAEALHRSLGLLKSVSSNLQPYTPKMDDSI